jgi:aspartate racemase
MTQNAGGSPSTRGSRSSASSAKAVRLRSKPADASERARVGPFDRTLGVLGGMGPAATADFLAALVACTPAGRDQDHIRTIVYADPRTPDRSEAMLGRGPSPLPAMLAGIDFLNAAPVDCIAIPCNSAHFWYDALRERALCPILHIAAAAVRDLRKLAARGSTVGVLATAGTIRAGIYQEALEGAGYLPAVPGDEEILQVIMPGIRAVKAGDIATAQHLLDRATRGMEQAGVDALILGCTDISVALDVAWRQERFAIIDANRSLAAASVAALGVGRGSVSAQARAVETPRIDACEPGPRLG